MGSAQWPRHASAQFLAARPAIAILAAMSAQSENDTAHLLRLNAITNPAQPAEEHWFDHYGLDPQRVEANTPQDILAHAADCDILFVVAAALPPEVVHGLERCRLISRLGNGTDKIAVDTATQRGIVVANAPYFCVAEMADHIMAMLLSLSRRLPAMDDHLRAGAYATARDEGVQLQRLSGKILGIVGFGATGPAVARRAAPFGLQILATRKNMAASIDPDLNVAMVDLNTLLARADYISLQLPLTPETHHLIDAAALAKMKPDACLINTSRGALVDEPALALALAAGRLAGAAIDTFEDIDIFAENPPPPTSPLLELDNIILTPHVAGLSVQAAADAARTGIENAVATLNNMLPPIENIVNKEAVPRFPMVPYDATQFARIGASLVSDPQ